MIELRRKRGLALKGQEPYLTAALTLLNESGCAICKYRTSATGLAYTGSKGWLIVVPTQTTLRRFMVLAHEVGHQELHRPERRERKVQRWQEEFEADAFALDAADRLGLLGDDLARTAANEIVAGWVMSTAERTLYRAKKPRALAGRMTAFAEERLDMKLGLAVYVELRETKIATKRMRVVLEPS